MSPLSIVNQVRVRAPLHERLERVRFGAMNALVASRAPLVADIRDACRALVERHDDAGRRVADEGAAKLLGELRASEPRSSNPLDHLAHRLDRVVRASTLEIVDRVGAPIWLKNLHVATLEWVNWVYGSFDLWAEAILGVLSPTREGHLHDLAAGSGGFARHLARLLRGDRRLTLSSSDVNPDHVRRGRALAAREGARVAFEVRDVLDLRSARGVDLFSCTLAAHHLEPGQVVRMISQAIAFAPRGIVIVDLDRSLTAAVATAAALAAVAPLPTVILDGVRSVRRSYTLAEYALFAHLAGAHRTDLRLIGPGTCFVHASGD